MSFADGSNSSAMIPVITKPCAGNNFRFVVTEQLNAAGTDGKHGSVSFFEWSFVLHLSSMSDEAMLTDAAFCDFLCPQDKCGYKFYRQGQEAKHSAANSIWIQIQFQFPSWTATGAVYELEGVWVHDGNRIRWQGSCLIFCFIGKPKGQNRNLDLRRWWPKSRKFAAFCTLSVPAGSIVPREYEPTSLVPIIIF